MFKNEQTQNRLRSRSLVNGTPSATASSSSNAQSPKQRPTVSSSYSAASVQPASPSIRVTYHEQDSSSTTDESTPPHTPVDHEEVPDSARIASHSAFRPTNLYQPADIKGKRKAVEWGLQQDMYPPVSGNSWVSIPVAPTPKQEKSSFAFEAKTTPPNKVPRLGQRRQTLDSLDSPLRSATSATSDLHSPLGSQPGLYSMAGPIGVLFVIFAASTCIVIFAISTLNLALPKSLSQVLEQATALKAYSKTSNAASIHILGVLGIMFIWKQAFSSKRQSYLSVARPDNDVVPGSLLTNVLFGSLYGVFYATLISSFATAVGSLACYYMSSKCGPLVHYLMPRPLATLQKNIDAKAKTKSDLFSYLLLMRLFPLLPYAVLNIAGGVLNVPISTFFWTLVLGSIPFNAVTTQVGDLLSSLPADAASNLSSIWTPALFFKLITISTISALPVLFKSRIQDWLGGTPAHADVSEMTEFDQPLLDEKHRRTASVERTSYDGSEEREEGDEEEALFELGEAAVVAASTAILV